MDYAPWIRIILRYGIGAALIGSQAIGEELAADPDLVAVLCAVAMLAVEAVYIRAKRKGGAT